MPEPALGATRRRRSAGARPLLRLAGFSYRYPGAAADALRNLSLEVAPGEMVVLSGRSGSGKSTLLRAGCGLVPHYFGGSLSGELEVAGHDVRESGPAQLGPLVGFVSQDPESQVVSATVRGELELPLELRGETPAVRARAVEEAGLALGIADLLDRTPGSLSGGELQRVALAAALVDRPRLVLLDEPTSQLDPVAGDELIGLLRRLNEEWGTAIVLSEHRLERCLAAADRVIALAAGEVAFDGRPEEFLAWALVSDSALSTPAARLFDGAGLRPPPVSVKAARAALARIGIAPTLGGQPAPALGGGPVATTGEHRGEGGGGPRRMPGGRRAAAALDARGVWVAHEDGGDRRSVLRRLELRVAPGELVALMGRNGAGKSTLLRTAAGRLRPARGRISAPRGAALLAQSPGDYLVRERVGDELPGPAGRLALELVGLDGLAERDPRDLSGGERQRLALAIVLAGHGAGGGPPGLVMLDEPTRGMDRARKQELRELVERLASQGAAILLATHDVEFAAAVAERVVLLGAGEVIADGGVGEVLSGGWYFSTEVARILGQAGTVTAEQGTALLRDRVAAAHGSGGSA